MKKIIITLFFVSTAASLGVTQASFQDTYLRYVSGHDLFRLLKQKFPRAVWEGNCDNFDNTNRSSLGDSNPVTGELMYRTPSVPFANWYLKCLLKGVDSEFTKALTIPHDFERYFGKEAVALIYPESYGNVLRDPKAVTWATLPANVQTLVATQIVEHFVGRNIIANQSEFVAKILTATTDKTLTTYDALKQLVLYTTTQDEFLTY